MSLRSYTCRKRVEIIVISLRNFIRRAILLGFYSGNIKNYRQVLQFKKTTSVSILYLWSSTHFNQRFNLINYKFQKRSASLNSPPRQNAKVYTKTPECLVTFREFPKTN